MTDLSHFVVVTQPQASSGLGGYLIEALRQQGMQVDLVDVMASTSHKLWPVVQSVRGNREAMWRARWENMLFSSWAWRRNSRRNAKLVAQVKRPNSRVLVVSKEYFPHEVGEASEYDVFILYTMKLSLADGITPWLPPERDRAMFLRLETELFQRARRIFTGGSYVKAHLVAEYGVTPERVIVAGGGVHPDYLEQAAKVVPDRFSRKMVFVGWDFGMKGGADLLAAFRRVHQERPELELLIAGPDQGQWVEQSGVRWLGPVQSKEELIALYRQADLFVMPSLRDSFGFVFLEAMTQGVPCIGTDLNAMPEIIEHGKTGYIVPLHDPEALGGAILGYYASEENRKRMGEAALKRVKEHYTWDSVANRILEG